MAEEEDWGRLAGQHRHPELEELLETSGLSRPLYHHPGRTPFVPIAAPRAVLLLRVAHCPFHVPHGPVFHCHRLIDKALGRSVIVNDGPLRRQLSKIGPLHGVVL